MLTIHEANGGLSELFEKTRVLKGLSDDAPFDHAHPFTSDAMGTERTELSYGKIESVPEQSTIV